jgi:threonine dehydrogenase-like Zn-dependent dehydrogenase
MISYIKGLRLSRLVHIKHGYQRNLSTKTINVPVCILGGGPVGLLLSSQLSSYGIKHCVVERRETPTKHPQAHFMNARTMEILQAHLPLAFKSVLHEMPSAETWRFLSLKKPIIHTYLE